MKYLKLVFLVVVSIAIFSCSSDDNNNNDGQPSTEYFNFTNDGEVLTVSNWGAIKSENTFVVFGETSDGIYVDFEFNAQGNVGSVATYGSDFSIPFRSSQEYYSDNTFDFEIITLNESAQQIKVSFSGKVYEDNYDVTSPFVNISGEFLVNYQVATPTVSGLGLKAKINNVDWYDSKSDQDGGFFSGSEIRLNFYNSDRNNIAIIVNHDSTVADTYSFTSSSASNKVLLSIYNPSEEYFEDYESEGTLVITEKTVGLQLTIISGTFSFMATNPVNNNQIQVTNGQFKTAYSNY
uniref:DUF6252 family protein n=1 Tax=Flavobacterium sp. TaxID=239 RepID=UPI0040492217